MTRVRTATGTTRTHSAEAAYSRSSDLCCLGSHSPLRVVLTAAAFGWAIGMLLFLEGVI